MRSRIVRQNKKINTVLLQLATVMLLFSVTSAGAQTNESTTSSITTTTAQSTSNQPPSNGGLDSNPNPYNEIGEVPIRKDAWTWYWNEKAHIDTINGSGFWGDDAISNLFKNISNSFIVPFWNAAMEYDIARLALLLVVAGMFIGFGASFFSPKKPVIK
jgi:hypothetical protein